jgi:hypothetical protein
MTRRRKTDRKDPKNNIDPVNPIASTAAAAVSSHVNVENQRLQSR